MIIICLFWPVLISQLCELSVIFCKVFVIVFLPLLYNNFY